MPALIKKIIRRLTRGRGFASGLLFILLLAQCVEARDYFAKQYGLECKKCHTRIPNLKEFGQNFKSNGYALTKRVPQPKVVTAGGEPSAALPQLSSIATTKESADSMSKDNSALQVAPSPPPEKTEYIYRAQSKNGTAIFTDNPLRIRGGNTARDAKASARTSPKSRRRLMATKSAFAGTPPRKDHEIRSHSDGPVKPLKSGRQEHAVAQQPSSLVKSQPEHFEACMEKILVEIDQPLNLKGTMELFEMAESSCAPYAARR